MSPRDRTFGHVTRQRALGVILAAVALLQAACSDCTLAVATKTLPDGTVGINYFAGLTSRCGGGDWFLQTGTLPPGVGLLENGDIKGIPTVAGVFQFTVGVIDFGSGEVAYKGFAITIVDTE